MNRSLESGMIFVQNYVSGKACNLYTLKLETGEVTLVGKLPTEVYDLDFVGQSLYGLSKKDFGFRKTMKLLKVDPLTGQSASIGDTQFDVVGLACNPVTQKLYATAHRNSQIVELNLTTGKGTPVATLSDRDRQCGELAFDASGQAYITLIGTDLKKYLATCNFSTGEVTLIGDIGFPGLASMKFIGDTLYGVAGEYEGVGGSNGQIIRIDPTTGQGTLIATTHPPLCWAGLAVYAAASVTTPEIPAVPIEPTPPSSEDLPPQSPPPQNGKSTLHAELMKLLTIDTKNNCYVIDPQAMGNLQENVASSFTLENGTFDIQITGGRYSYNAAETEGEPFVLLWIYGVDGHTFINNNTGVEIGTTWTTLNGYSDRLQLQVDNKAVVCALFFDVNSQDNSGTVELTISSNKPDFSAQKLSVNSQQNCYLLSESKLKVLQQWGSNFVELDPGNYRIKIRESTASYWSEEQKFQLEPWALLWLKVGRFVPQLTGIEVKETWCSLNGLQDEFIFEVKEKTTLSGFFFDTYKDDNEGQIILAVEALTASDGDNASKGDNGATNGDSDGSAKLPVKTTGGSFGYITSGGGGSNISEEINFTFNFDDSQMETAWQAIAAKVEAAITASASQDVAMETRRWDQFESWLLTGYKAQAKELAMKVARLELTLDTFKQQLEGNLQLTFQKWSTYFDGRLESLIGRQITEVTRGTLSVALEQLKLDILNQVTQLIQAETSKTAAQFNDLRTELNRSIELRINDSQTEISRNIEAQVTNLKAEIYKRIETQVNQSRVEVTQNFETQLNHSRTEINQYVETQIGNSRIEVNKSIEAQINALRTEITHNLEAQISTIKADVDRDIQAEIDKRIEARITNFRAEINKELETQLTQVKVMNVDVDNIVTTDVTENLRTNIQRDLDVKLADLRTSITTLGNSVDTKIETLRVNFRGEVVAMILRQINQLIEEKTKLEIAKVDFNTYLTQIDARANRYLDRLNQLEVTLIARINEGDAHLYNWVLEQLITLKGCIADRQVLVDQLEAFSNELKAKLDGAPCVSPTSFAPWSPLSATPQTLPGVNSPQLPPSS